MLQDLQIDMLISFLMKQQNVLLVYVQMTQNGYEIVGKKKEGKVVTSKSKNNGSRRSCKIDEQPRSKLQVRYPSRKRGAAGKSLL
jgi:hypothetical protein